METDRLIISVLYIGFKILLKSKVVPMEEISFTSELESIRDWKETEAIEAEKSQVGMAKKIWDKIF